MNAQIERFCLRAVQEGLLTAGQCRAVADAMREADIQAELTVFAQVVVDNELCDDVARLEQLMAMAVDEARTLGPPTESVFEGDVSVPPAAEIGGGEGGGPAVAVSSGGLGVEWPDLSAAEHLSAGDARALMDRFLACAREAGCSDVHVSAGAHPFVRRHKSMVLLDDQPVLTPEAAENLNLSLLAEDERDAYEQTHDLDYSYAASETERYRTNVLLQRLGVAGSYRIIDNEVRTLDELGFPRADVIEKLTTYHQGLILVTGPAGCGKSTTLASLIDLINRNRKDHIITVEDPIEVVHPPKSCNITQREIGNHTKSFSNALRAALREDPDIIVIGELRDLETIEMAIRASETGHLVIGTLHTGSAASTMDRVLDVFPPNQQAQIRSMAAESLKGVICQQLVANAAGDGVVLAVEIMLGTLAVANIVREGETFKLPSIIQTSYNIGMCLLEQSYFDLYMAGKITFDLARTRVQAQDQVAQMQANEARRAAEAAGLPQKKGWFR